MAKKVILGNFRVGKNATNWLWRHENHDLKVSIVFEVNE